MDEELDQLKAEVFEQQVLLDKGLTFKAGDQEFLISQPRLGQLDKMATQLIKLDINKLELESDDHMRRFAEYKRMVHPNAERAARIIAIACVSHYRPNVFLFFWYRLKESFLIHQATKRILYQVTPGDLFKLTNIVLKAANLADFTNSIALLSINRTTAPQAIEDDQLD